MNFKYIVIVLLALLMITSVYAAESPSILVQRYLDVKLETEKKSIKCKLLSNNKKFTHDCIVVTKEGKELCFFVNIKTKVVVKTDLIKKE